MRSEAVDARSTAPADHLGKTGKKSSSTCKQVIGGSKDCCSHLPKVLGLSPTASTWIGAVDVQIAGHVFESDSILLSLSLFSSSSFLEKLTRPGVDCKALQIVVM